MLNSYVVNRDSSHCMNIYDCELLKLNKTYMNKKCVPWRKITRRIYKLNWCSYLSFMYMTDISRRPVIAFMFNINKCNSHYKILSHEIMETLLLDMGIIPPLVRNSCIFGEAWYFELTCISFFINTVLIKMSSYNYMY